MSGRFPGNLRAALSQRARRWAARRQGIDSLPLRLGARRIYIVPTRGGMGFALLLLTMLVAGLNYTNSLALFLTFMLAGFALVAMLQCHRRLLGLSVDSITVEPGFAGGELRVAVAVTAQAAQAITDLRLTVESTASEVDPTARDVHASPDDLLVTASTAAGRRGIWKLERLKLHETAPFGLFRAWVWIHADVSTVVYPRPAGMRPVPPAPGDEAGSHARSAGLDEWSGLRPFRDGDSPRQVAWKIFARGGALLVKEYQGNTTRQRVFDFESLQGLDVESALSQLCAWIVAAAARNEAYTLALPGTVIGPGGDAAHRHRCLAALAVHGMQAQQT